MRTEAGAGHHRDAVRNYARCSFVDHNFVNVGRSLFVKGGR